MQLAHADRERTGDCRQAAGFGFTLVELMVSLGVVLILVALLLPNLAKTRERARAARMVAIMHSNAAALATYASDHDDVFPIAAPRVNDCMLEWTVPLAAHGHLARPRDADPDGYSRHGTNRVAMSGAVVHPSRMMQPGATVPIDLAPSEPVRHSTIRHPSQKGVLVQWLHIEAGRSVFWTYNTVDRPISPITMADGSVRSQRCTDFVIQHGFFENWVGHPVLSTWGGSEGVDRTE